MGQTPYTWTVDVDGGDFGGRTNTQIGLLQGLPRILRLFKDRNIKGLFFISTELLPQFRREIRSIGDAGHEIASHGHFHVVYRDWRWKEDKRISELMLLPIANGKVEYRAPKFSNGRDSGLYSKPDRHVGLLRRVWLRTYIPINPIFYVHPFDVVKGERPPNLFCRFWYSNPERAYEVLGNLTRLYPGIHRLR